jgi:signal transduction histidine kinase/ligand-binding sensor domain-containing protein
MFLRAGRRAICTALIVWAGAGPASAETRPHAGSVDSTYALTVWSAETGASPGDVFAITEDREGYLWLGTQTGLVRFDGFKFVTWADAAGTPVPGPVLAVAGARDGSLWVGGSAGVFRVSGANVYHVSEEPGFEGTASALIEDRQGAIWVGNRRGLFRYAGGKWTRITEADGYRGREVFSLHEDQSGRLWVGSSFGVFRSRDDGFELVDARSDNVQSFAEDDSGAMWVTDDAAIVRRFESPANATFASDIRLPTSSWKLLHDSRGRIWIAALGGGLLHLENAGEPGAIVRRFDYERRMTGSTRSLYEDREGNIWVGLRGGLLRLSEAMFRTDTPLDGLTQDGVRTMAVSNDGSVWVATSHNINRFSGGERTIYPLAQTLNLYSDPWGVMWASTSEGLWRFSNGQFRKEPVPGSINWGRVLSLVSAAPDTLWLCSSLTGVMSWDGKSLSQPTDQKELTERACSTMFRDRRGRVWVGFGAGGGGGAALYENARLRSIDTRDGLTPGAMVAVSEDSSGSVWLATASGLNRYRDGRITAITPPQAPLVELLPTMVEDAEGFLWIGTRSGSGMLRIHPREVDKLVANPAAALEYAVYDNTDGLSQSALSWRNGVTGVRGGDGRLWFATGLGLAIYDPRTRPRPRRATAPQVEGVVADGRRLEAAKDLALPNGTSTLRLEYGAISLSGASKLRFRYMLEGLHDDWVMAGSAREAVFNDLPSGNYRFRVAATYEGPWIESQAAAISVAPPYYRTGWFLTATMATALSLLAAAWWFRLRSVRNQYALVFAERTRLSREIHDTLLQSLAAIGLELETIATQLDPAQDHARDGLRRLRRQVGHSLREARESILDLRRNPMKRRGLVQSLTDLAENTTRGGITTEFALQGRLDGGSDELDVQLFRIAQEAVGNARKHGHATQVHLTLLAGPAQIVLRVEDNGQGFEPDPNYRAASAGEHLGLLSMRERAERLRGRLAIVSAPGRGTTVEATVPLPAE